MTLEAWGNLDWIDAPARDSLFVKHIRMTALMMGVPDPVDGWTLRTPKPARRVRAAASDRA